VLVVLAAAAAAVVRETDEDVTPRVEVRSPEASGGTAVAEGVVRITVVGGVIAAETSGAEILGVG